MAGLPNVPDMSTTSTPLTSKQRVALAVELQRDWGRPETVQEVVQIVLTERLLKEE